ncbi:LysM peptidoglycan-binding domain-containing protein, partial [Lysobacter sp. 2RAB21]
SGLALAGGELFPSAAAGSDANVGAKVFSTTLASSEVASTSGSAEAPDASDSSGKKTKAGKNVAAAPRRHTVGRGENAWTIAKRYGVRAADLLKLNGLNAKTVLKPGQALLIDGPKPGRK